MVNAVIPPNIFVFYFLHATTASNAQHMWIITHKPCKLGIQLIRARLGGLSSGHAPLSLTSLPNPNMQRIAHSLRISFTEAPRLSRCGDAG
jgi:hypothetical protein